MRGLFPLLILCLTAQCSHVSIFSVCIPPILWRNSTATWSGTSTIQFLWSILWSFIHNILLPFVTMCSNLKDSVCLTKLKGVLTSSVKNYLPAHNSQRIKATGCSLNSMGVLVKCDVTLIYYICQTIVVLSCKAEWAELVSCAKQIIITPKWSKV